MIQCLGGSLVSQFANATKPGRRDHCPAKAVAPYDPLRSSSALQTGHWHNPSFYKLCISEADVGGKPHRPRADGEIVPPTLLRAYQLGFKSTSLQVILEIFRHLWCKVHKGSTLNVLQQFLLSQVAARFDLGSGTPKPHTSTGPTSMWLPPVV